MARYFLPQRSELTQEERAKLTDEKISELNRYLTQQKGAFAQEYGIDLSDPDASAEKQGRAAPVFLLRDGKISTLQENNIKPGSREFWESAMKGQLFAYPLGKQDPVQLQAWIGVDGLAYSESKPLSPDAEVPFPDEPVKRKPPTAPTKPVYPQMQHPKPDPVADPGEEPPRPSLLTKIAAFFGRKASKQKIATHANWVRDSAAFADFQEKLQAHLEEKEDLDDSYLIHVGQFQNANGQYQVNVETYKSYEERYAVEHKAWEAESARKDELIAARKESGRIIAEAFAGKRTPEVLKAEQEEAKLRHTLESATSDYRHGEAGYENGMTMFAPRPRFKEEWIESDRYTKKDFDKLSEVKLDGLTVGTEPKPVTDAEYAALAMFANLTAENALSIAKISSPPLLDEEATAKIFEEFGYNREEFNELLIAHAVPMVLQDVMQWDNPRNPMGPYIGMCMEPSRQRAMKALQDYQKGDKQLLAEIISRGMEFVDQAARMGADFNETTQGMTRFASDAAAMMERDPELKAMAAAAYEKRENAIHERHKDFTERRSMEDILQNLKNYEKLRELQTKSCEAQKKLALAGAGKLTLTDAEKLNCVRDTLRNLAVRASHHAQVQKKTDAAAKVFMELQAQATEKCGRNESLIPLTKNFNTYIMHYYVPKTLKGEPNVLDMLGDGKWQDSIGKAVETTINFGLRTSGNDLDKLCARVLSGNDTANGDPAFHSSNILKTMAQAKAAADAAKQPEPDKTAVLAQGQPVREKDEPQSEGPEAT